MTELLRRYSAQVANLRLLAHGVSPAITRPLDLERIDVASSKKRAARHALSNIPMFLILAAFAIQNPRILLNATPKGHPQGLGNARDLVGRYFMDHPYVQAGQITVSDPDAISELYLFPDTGIERLGPPPRGTLTIEGLLCLPEDETLECAESTCQPG